jgi:hypothetical protein
MIYLDMLLLYLVSQLEDHQPNLVFQQDGAPNIGLVLSENVYPSDVTVSKVMLPLVQAR